MKKGLQALLLITLFLLGETRARRLYSGEAAAVLPLADGVAHWVKSSGPGTVSSPGGSLFDGEWALVSCQMTVIGLSQVIEQHPETRARYLPAARSCMAWMLTAEARAFGTGRWGEDGMANLSGQPTHAYLGYIGVALARYRRIDDEFAAEHAALKASLTAALSAPIHQFQTYPGETYPADLATVAATLALHEPPPALADWMARFEAAAVDPVTGLLYQSLSPTTGRPVDRPRGSGTAFAAYFLAPADRDLSRALSDALTERRFLGFGGIREYAPGVRGRGDIDSGPVLMGIGVSATGFGIAGARIHGDADRYRALTRTSTLFGLPVPLPRGRWHLTGGGLGNAIMLAMLTAE